MAATGPLSIQITGVQKFLVGLDRFGEYAEYLDKQTWEEVASVFYDAEEKIFASEGTPNKFVALSPAYARWKAANYGSKPIMQLTGALKDAATGKGATPGKAVPIKRIIARKGASGITLGVRSPYGHRHQKGNDGMPKREWVQVTVAEQVKFVKVLHAALVRIERSSWGGLRT